MVVSQLAGLLECKAGKGGDANPEMMYDHILQCTIVCLEHKAEAEAHEQDPAIKKWVHVQHLVDEVGKVLTTIRGDDMLKEAIHLNAIDKAKSQIKKDNTDDLEEWQSAKWHELLEAKMARILQATLEEQIWQVYISEACNSLWMGQCHDEARATVANEVERMCDRLRAKAQVMCVAEHAQLAGQRAREVYDSMLLKEHNKTMAEVKNECLCIHTNKMEAFECALDLSTREESMAAV